MYAFTYKKPSFMICEKGVCLFDFVTKNGIAYGRLTGNVSTENNGGFIQFRTRLDTPQPRA